MEHIVEQLDEWHIKWEAEASKKHKPAIDRSAILRKIERLKDLYLNDLITMEEYRHDYDQFSAQLNESLASEPPAPDFAGLRQKLSGDFINQYRAWDAIDRRTFWREIIKKIEISAKNTPQIFFE